MTYQFQEVNIYFFDVHTVSKALTNPACVLKGFEFLVDENQYGIQYQAANVLKTAHLEIRPLSKRSLLRNHFWKRYKDVRIAAGKPDYWNLQLPFVCRPIEAKVKLNPGKIGIQAYLRPAVFLSGTGWSSNLHIHLSGNIQDTALIDFLSNLHSSKDAFQIDGQLKKLVDVFRFFADCLREEVYSADCSPVDVESISKYSVISIAQFKGPLNYYKSQYTGQPKMSHQDSRILFSILRGKAKTLDEWIQETNENTFSITYSNDRPDFGLIDFNKAVLIFMQQAASGNANITLRCHGSNVRLCYMMVFSLLAICDQLKTAAASDPKLDKLRKGLLITLKEVPNLYKNNMFCRALYSNHKRLQSL